MNFRIRGLDARQFDHLFALSDPEPSAVLSVASPTDLALVASVLPMQRPATS